MVDEGLREGLRVVIRSRLAAGTLPRIEGNAWAGTAQGHRKCACCDPSIDRSMPEYEPREHPGLYAHIHCFTVWRDESRV